jgi:glycerol uptake facilitator-like aquaporin
MPGSVVAELILRPIVELVLYVFGYLTGYVVVPAVTFGLYSVEHLVSGSRRLRPRLKSAKASLGSHVVSADVAALVGICFWVLVITGGYLLWRASGV